MPATGHGERGTRGATQAGANEDQRAAAETADLVARLRRGEVSAEQVAAGARAGGAPERVVTFRLRSLLAVVGLLLALAAAVRLVAVARSGLTLITIALFLALALNPAVQFFQRRGLRRGLAVMAVSILALLVFALLGLVIIPPLVEQTTNFVHALPGLVSDLGRGRGPLGFLERRYHVVEQVHVATAKKGSSGLLTGAAAPGFSLVKGVVTRIVGTVIIAFMTLFMLIEGPAWRRRLTELVPPGNRALVERVGAGVYKAISGFVAGNLLASLLAGVVSTLVLLVTGIPYAVPLGLFAVIIELVPYIGPVVVTVLLSVVALARGVVPALVVLLVLVAYHLIEGHTLRPLIYGRALRLSPLAVIIAILLGTEIAGILGALAAIPVAGAVQVVIAELLDQRGARKSAASIG